MIDNDDFGVHESGGGVEVYLDAIQVQPVQRSYGTLTGACRIVVGEESDLDAFLMDSIEQCWEDGEGLCLLFFDGTSNTVKAFFRKMGAVVPTVKSCSDSESTQEMKVSCACVCRS